MRFIKALCLFVIPMMTLAQCGGGGGGKKGGGGGEASGLEIADQMALVTAQESSTPSNLTRASSKLAGLLSRAPSGGDYASDEAEYYVFDKSMEDLDIVNEILCMIRQTNYFDSSLLNAGPYIALVDEEACGQREDHSMDGSNQSSGQEVSYEEWFVSSTREDDSSPQVVEFWILPAQDFEWDTTEEIRARLEISEAQSESNPFGLFEMNFSMVDEFGPFMSGVLFSREADGDNVEIGMVMDGGEGYQMNIHARMKPDGSSGQGYSAFDWYEFEGDPEDQDLSQGILHQDRIRVAFNDTHYLARYEPNGEVAETECLDRINYRTNVWEYNLYDSNGTRADLNGGFGIRYGAEEDQIWGHAGYFGVWLPEDQVTIENGMEVTRANDGTSYTVFQGLGRLMRRTRGTLQLGDFVGDVFHHWHSPSYGENEFVFDFDLINKIFNESTNVNAGYTPDTGIITIEAKEVGAAGNSIALACTGGFACSGSTLTGGNSTTFARGTVTVGTLNIGDTLRIGTVTYTRVAEKQGENLEVEWDGTHFIAIGTEDCSGENGCTFVPQAEEVLAFEANEWVSLWKDGLGSLQLVVPENGIITNDMDVPYYSEDNVDPSDSIFDSGDLDLQCYYNCPKAYLTADDLNSGNPFYDDIGEGGDPYLYTFSADDYVLLFNGEPVTIEDGADLSGGSYHWGMRSGAMVLASVDLENPWDIWSADTIYEWETGPSQWNKYQGLVDAGGEAVTFDRPLACLYHDDTNGTFFLQYEGVGQLHGIPYEKIEDEEFEFEHWVPLFAIPDGSELECDGSTYYSRQIKIEQFMQEVGSSECESLAIDEDFGAADDAFDDPGMDSHPDVTSAPAVIGGVLQ